MHRVFIFCVRGQVHLIKRGETYRGYLVVFSEDFFNLRFNNMEVIPGYPLVTNLENGLILNLNNELFEEFHHFMKNIENKLIEGDSDSVEIIISYLKIFFLKLRHNFSKLITTQNKASSTMKKTVCKFNQLVDKYYDQIHHIKRVRRVDGNFAN